MQYSDIFNKYSIDGITFNNILKKIQFPSDKTSDIYGVYDVPHTMPWIYVSHRIYNDISYYWLILLCNTEKKLNPLYAEVGAKIFIIKPEYLDLVISAIKENIQ